MTQQKGQAWIGTSGWQYDHWRGVFYPDEYPKKEWFSYYVEHFRTVEVNNTFYHLPEAETFDHWREQAPKGFLYVLKFSRYGSHLKKLKDPADSIGAFLDRAKRLKQHLGPILVQLPPHWSVDVERMDAFLDAAGGERRWAVEFRDPSWLCEDVYTVLRNHQAALCIHDLLPDHPRMITTDWVYLRFHGPGSSGAYSYQKLTGVARRIRKHQAEGRDVYAFFNNDAKGHAVHNALQLQRYVSEA